jgi:pimeloyl-ACP methyl ester carboxylesterase
MSGTGNPAMPSAAPDVMAMMMRPAPDPTSDAAAFIAHGVAFARRIAGSAHPFDEAACRALIGEEIRRGIAPGGLSRQLAATALAGDRRAQLAKIRAPALVIHGTEDPLIPPACGEDTAAAIPGAELMPIAGMGHDVPAPLFRTITRAIDHTARRSL